MELAFKLLEQMGVTGFYGPLESEGVEHNLKTFTTLFNRAFEGDRIVVVVQRHTRQLFIVGSVVQIWDNVSRFEPQGIDMVLAIPQETWDKIRPNVNRRVHDLRKVSA